MANADLTIAEFRDIYSGALIGDRTKDSVTGADQSDIETAVLDAAAELVLGKLRRAYTSSTIADGSYPISVRVEMYRYAMHMLARRTGTLNAEIEADFGRAVEQVERWATKVDPILGLTPDVMLPSSSRSTSEKKMTFDPTADGLARGTLDEIVTFPYTGSGNPK